MKKNGTLLRLISLVALYHAIKVAMNVGTYLLQNYPSIFCHWPCIMVELGGYC